ncbi:hypothetical protein BGZ75_010221 [Mortierella antarctica]|nr:hypothetical protein BGZ75_010221 [Mortierella antarctica]
MTAECGVEGHHIPDVLEHHPIRIKPEVVVRGNTKIGWKVFDTPGGGAVLAPLGYDPRSGFNGFKVLKDVLWLVLPQPALAHVESQCEQVCACTRITGGFKDKVPPNLEDADGMAVFLEDVSDPVSDGVQFLQAGDGGIRDEAFRRAYFRPEQVEAVVKGVPEPKPEEVASVTTDLDEDEKSGRREMAGE